VRTAEAFRALALTSVLLVACGDEKTATTTVASTLPETTSVATSVAPTTSPLEGTWRTQVVSPTDAEQTLEQGGLSEWVDEFRARAPFAGETVLVLEIGDEWDLYGESADGVRAEIDFDASYEIDGDTVVVSHSAGSNTFRWSVENDTLRLEHLETSMPTFEGVPEEVFQRALYMTSEFTLEQR
jgi:hypothetical protein